MEVNQVKNGGGFLESHIPLCFDSETRQKIGAITFIVAAHFDETRESLPEKIQRLLCIEIENKIAHLPNIRQ